MRTWCGRLCGLVINAGQRRGQYSHIEQADRVSYQSQKEGPVMFEIGNYADYQFCVLRPSWAPLVMSRSFVAFRGRSSGRSSPDDGSFWRRLTALSRPVTAVTVTVTTSLTACLKSPSCLLKERVPLRRLRLGRIGEEEWDRKAVRMSGGQTSVLDHDPLDPADPLRLAQWSSSAYAQRCQTIRQAGNGTLRCMERRSQP